MLMNEQAIPALYITVQHFTYTEGRSCTSIYNTHRVHVHFVSYL